jgi:hypothetical protein
VQQRHLQLPGAHPAVAGLRRGMHAQHPVPERDRRAHGWQLSSPDPGWRRAERLPRRVLLTGLHVDLRRRRRVRQRRDLQPLLPDLPRSGSGSEHVPVRLRLRRAHRSSDEPAAVRHLLPLVHAAGGRLHRRRSLQPDHRAVRVVDVAH